MSRKNPYAPGTLALLLSGNLFVYTSLHPITRAPLVGNPYMGIALTEKWPYATLGLQPGQVLMLIATEKDWMGCRYLHLLSGDSLGWTCITSQTWLGMIENFEYANR